MIPPAFKDFLIKSCRLKMARNFEMTRWVSFSQVVEVHERMWESVWPMIPFHWKRRLLREMARIQPHENLSLRAKIETRSKTSRLS